MAQHRAHHALPFSSPFDEFFTVYANVSSSFLFCSLPCLQSQEWGPAQSLPYKQPLNERKG